MPPAKDKSEPGPFGPDKCPRCSVGLFYVVADDDDSTHRRCFHCGKSESYPKVTGGEDDG